MPAYTTVTVDAEGCLRTWLNTLTSSLVGVGQPVAGGFFLEPQRSPSKGVYGVISRLAGTEGLGVEAAADMARISVSFFAPGQASRQAAAAAAVAYANIMRGVSTVQPQLPVFDAVIRLADNIAGPTFVPNINKALPQYLVDADIYFSQLT